MLFFACEDGAEIVGCVAFSQRVHADKTLLLSEFEGRHLAAFNLKSGAFQKSQQRVKVLRLLRENFINRSANALPMGERGIAPPLVVALSVTLGIFNNGVAVFNADGVTEPTQRHAASLEIAELAVMGKGRGIEDNMVMDMVFIRVGADDVGMVAFGEAMRQLTAETVRFLRRNFARGKGLAQMIGDHIVHAA